MHESRLIIAVGHHQHMFHRNFSLGKSGQIASGQPEAGRVEPSDNHGTISFCEQRNRARADAKTRIDHRPCEATSEKDMEIPRQSRRNFFGHQCFWRISQNRNPRGMGNSRMAEHADVGPITFPNEVTEAVGRLEVQIQGHFRGSVGQFDEGHGASFRLGEGKGQAAGDSGHTGSRMRGRDDDHPPPGIRNLTHFAEQIRRGEQTLPDRGGFPNRANSQRRGIEGTGRPAVNDGKNRLFDAFHSSPDARSRRFGMIAEIDDDDVGFRFSGQA